MFNVGDEIILIAWSDAEGNPIPLHHRIGMEGKIKKINNNILFPYEIILYNYPSQRVPVKENEIKLLEPDDNEQFENFEE